MLKSSNSCWGCNLSLFSWYFSAVYIQHCPGSLTTNLGFLAAHRAQLSLNDSHKRCLFCFREGPITDSCDSWRCLSKKSNGIESHTPRPKAFLLEGSMCSEYAPSFPSPRKDKDCWSSKPVSIESSSNTCSHSYKSTFHKWHHRECKTTSLGCMRCLPRHQYLLRIGLVAWVYPD